MKKLNREIKHLDFTKIMEILREEDEESVYEKTNIVPNSRQLYKALAAYIDPKNMWRKSVLGIDIYRYG